MYASKQKIRSKKRGSFYSYGQGKSAVPTFHAVLFFFCYQFEHINADNFSTAQTLFTVHIHLPILFDEIGLLQIPIPMQFGLLHLLLLVQIVLLPQCWIVEHPIRLQQNYGRLFVLIGIITDFALVWMYLLGPVSKGLRDGFLRAIVRQSQDRVIVDTHKKRIYDHGWKYSFLDD